MSQTPDAPECPECGGELLRGEDPHGVTWQCFAHDCLSHFAGDEITRATSTIADGRVG